MPYRTDPLIIGGNMAGWTSKTTNANRIIIWNEENRVKSITDSGSATEFLYDDSGERAVKGGGGNETVYLNRFYSLKNGDLGSKHIFAGDTRICTKIEKDGGSIQSGVPGWSAFDGSGRDGLYNALSRGNTTKIDYKRGIVRRLPGTTGTVTASPPIEKFEFFYHGDHLGSSSFITDDAGAVYQHLEYFPYGETWVEDGGSGQMPYYKFTGKDLDPETGLYYYGARYYDPVLSRWISADPILDQYLNGKANDGVYRSLNINLYHYAANNPIRLLDPTGLAADENTDTKPPVDEIEQAIRDRQWQFRNTQEGLTKVAPIAEAAASLNPLVSATEAVTGKSSIEGRELSFGERLLSMPIIGGALKFLGLGGKIAGKAFAPGKWLSHFEKHGAEFGAKTSVEYLRGAQKLTSGVEEGVQTFVRANGDTLFYRASTNEFSAVSREVVIRTYFKPGTSVD